MCLILMSYNHHPNYRLILAANRDEFYSRPTEPAKVWDDYPAVLAGRDLEQQGTWLGITAEGRFAILTNYRAPAAVKAGAASRGKLVSAYLTCSLSPSDYLERVKKERHLYNPFNLLVGNKTSLFFYSSMAKRIELIKPGIYGLSNHRLDTPWPKVVKGKDSLSAYVRNNGRIEPHVLFNILADTTSAPDSSLPDTGVGIARERLLSSIFIEKTESGYGTRASTVLLIDRFNRVLFSERTFNGSPDSIREEVTCEFNLNCPVFTFR